MSKRTLFFAGPIALAGCALALAAQKGAPAPDHGVAARLKMARDAFKLIDQRQKNGNPVDSDTMSTWSKRLMESEQDAAKTKGERIAAVQGHVDRVGRMLEN